MGRAVMSNVAAHPVSEAQSPPYRVAPFVIITPAHNEEAFIEETIRSMLRQRVRPMQWLIVNDGSTDRTRDIVAAHAAQHGFIRLIDRHRQGARHFGNKAHAFHLGLSRCDIADFLFIGNLDADISLEPDYFEKVLQEFEREPQLGIAGGMVQTRIGGCFISQEVALDSVAGAVQLFRRECFEQVGGYKPLPLGGIDSAAEITARMRGWRVQTFPALRVLENRRTGTATATPLLSRMKEGQRYHSLGYGFLFLCLRCVYRSMDRPRVMGSLAILIGYLRGLLGRSPILLPPDTVRYLRDEQQNKLRQSLKSLVLGKSS
jgi:glycosyltransferase involved in cell wall biosynthesis